MNFDHFKIRLLTVLRFYLITFVGSLFLFFLGRFVSQTLSKIFLELVIDNTASSSDFIKSYGTLSAFIILVLKSPLIEEVIFRSWVLPSKLNVFASFLAFSQFLVLYLFNGKLFGNIVIVNIWLIINGLYISFFLDKDICLRVSSYSSIFVVISGVLFGISHLINFDLLRYKWYICIPYVFPQVFSGIIFGVVRYQYGFWYAVAVHSMINFTSFFAGFF